MDPNKSIYIGQEMNTYNNVELFLKQNGFKITRVDCNDVTNCEYNVFFEKV